MTWTLATVTLQKMDPGHEVIYRLVLRGELGDNFGFLFSGMQMSREDGTTVLTGPVADQAHLAAIIEKTQDMGLEVISLGTLDQAPGSQSKQA